MESHPENHPESRPESHLETLNDNVRIRLEQVPQSLLVQREVAALPGFRLKILPEHQQG